MPHKRIDFIGPPGSGKSTVISLIEDIQNNWLARSTLIPQIMSTYYRKHPVSFSDRLKSLYYILKRENKITGIDKVKLKLFYSDNFHIHRHVLLSAYQTLSNDEDEREFVKTVRIELLNEVLKDQLLFQHHSHSATFGLFDDSFCNMLLLSILPRNIKVDMFKAWAEPIRTTHFPDGVIILESNSETLFQRLKTRKRKNSSHLHLDDKKLRVSLERQIDLYEKTEMLLCSIGIPVLKISTVGNQNSYIEKSKEFISSL